MAKLVDALVSGTSVSNYVQVRVLFRAQKERKLRKKRKFSQIKKRLILYIVDYKQYSFCGNLRFLRNLRSK